MPLARTFNKINMAELGKIILRDIEQTLGRDDSFRPNLTALEAAYDFKLTLTVVPSSGEPEQEYNTVLSGGRTFVEQRGNEIISLVPQNAERQRIEITQGRRHSALTEPPDLLRQQAGLHIPAPQMDPATGIIVDIPREEVVKEQLERQDATDKRRQAIRERDELMKGKAPIRFEGARPVEELAQDVVESPDTELRGDIIRAERVATTLPPEHVVVEE